VPAGADQAFDISLHQDLQHRLRHGSQKIAIAALLQQVNQRHSVVGRRVLGGSRVKRCNSTLAALPGDHLSLTRAPGSKFSRFPPAARLQPIFHHQRGRYPASAPALEALADKADESQVARPGWRFDTLVPYLLRDWTNTPELCVTSSRIGARSITSFPEVVFARCGASDCWRKSRRISRGFWIRPDPSNTCGLVPGTRLEDPRSALPHVLIIAAPEPAKLHHH